MNMIKKMFQIVSCLLILGVGSAGAVAVEDLEAQELQREYIHLKSSGTSYAHAITLWYVGTATESVVTITSTAIQAFAPAGGGNGDTTFGTANSAYDLSAAAYDTIGELCGAIDGLANYECLMAGAISNDNSNTLRDQTGASGTNDLKANRGFEVHFDTGNANGGGDVRNLFDLRVGRKPSPGKRLVLKQCIGITKSTNGDFRVFGKPKWAEVNPNPNNWSWDDTYEVYRDTFTQDVSKTWNFAPSGLGGISFAKDAHVAVSMGNETSLAVGSANATPSQLECWFYEQ